MDLNWLLRKVSIYQIDAKNKLRVKQVFDLDKENKINCNSSKRHLKINKIAKFGWQITINTKSTCFITMHTEILAKSIIKNYE